ncbi:hypothetical protein GQR58_015337 [Nymphon striatum]|nr:hypothetical protein GQR58_015337 [Nymphon striatum]
MTNTFSYQDYVRDYHHQRPPLPPVPYGPSHLYGMNPSSYYHERPPSHHDFATPRNRLDKRSYERSVDDFLRRTSGSHSSRDRRYQDRLVIPLTDDQDGNIEKLYCKNVVLGAFGGLS